MADLLRQGYSEVRAVDLKPPNQWFQTFPQADNRSLDLREKDNCYRALENADHVYNLAADMGGMSVAYCAIAPLRTAVAGTRLR